MTEIFEEYKETELGLLPESWGVVKLGDVFEFSRKPRDLKIKENAKIPFIPMKYISESDKPVKWQFKQYSQISSGTFVFRNDLIIAKITPSFENGKQAIISNLPNDFGYATTEIWAVHPKKENVISEQLYGVLKIPDIRKNLAFKMEGTTGRQRIPRYVLENQKIPLPPLPEQKKITSVLSTIQTAKEKTEQVINATKELKKSLMKHLFTYGHVSLEDAEKVKLKETEIGEIPENWDVKEIQEICDLVMGQSPPGNTYNKKEGMPFLQGKAEFSYIHPTHIKFTSKPLKIGKKDGILMSVRAPVGDVNIADNHYCIGRGLCSISMKNNNNKFLYYSLILRKSDIQREGTGSTFKAINKSKVQQFKLAFPPEPNQQKISSILSTIDSKIETEENKKNALEELFKSMLHNLMTAQIRVNKLAFKNT